VTHDLCAVSLWTRSMLRHYKVSIGFVDEDW